MTKPPLNLQLVDRWIDSLEQLAESNGAYYGAADMLLQDIIIAKGLLAALRETRAVLAYYADPKQYQDGEYGYQLIAPIEFDKGAKAVAALAKVRDDA